jgi:hypothetical protein
MKLQLKDRIPADVGVVDGFSDWKENFHRCGGWNGWAEDVATGRTLTGQHRFEAIVCPYLTVGKATAQIVERALHLGKPVVHLARDGTIAKVTGINREDDDSWKAGWTLVTERRTG